MDDGEVFPEMKALVRDNAVVADWRLVEVTLYGMSASTTKSVRAPACWWWKRNTQRHWIVWQFDRA